ncbi:MAG: LUD domain-containing protein [Micrococcus sp.]|nr:LUD domain-containing protein [Micrococcus sp.]
MKAQTDAKSVILGRIREALADQPTPDPVERTYRRRSEASRDAVIEQLEDRLLDYKAAVYRETADTVAARVGELLHDADRYVVPEGLDPAWLPEESAGVGRERITEPAVGQPGAQGVRALNEIDAVVTSSTVSCSETGTIFLTGRADEGRRAISLVPDHHVCIVGLDTVVELIPEALERVDPRAVITMISGPSATSDIELERVEGVHGPRRLDVILLER